MPTSVRLPCPALVGFASGVVISLATTLLDILPDSEGHAVLNERAGRDDIGLTSVIIATLDAALGDREIQVRPASGSPPTCTMDVRPDDRCR